MQRIDWMSLIIDWQDSDLLGARSHVRSSWTTSYVQSVPSDAFRPQITNWAPARMVRNVPCRAWFMFSSVTRCSRVSHAPAQMWVRTQTVILISSLIPALNDMSACILKGRKDGDCLFPHPRKERINTSLEWLHCGTVADWGGGYFQV